MLVEIRFVRTVVVDTETNQIVSSTETVENSSGVSAPVATSPAKKRQQKIKEEVVVDNNESPTVKLEDGKLVLSNSTISILNSQAGDRISVTYLNNNNEFYPVIAKSDTFGDIVSGNKLTKAGTVSFKGKQAESLSQYGKDFDLIAESTEGVYKLVDKNHVGIATISEDELVENKEVVVSPKDHPAIENPNFDDLGLGVNLENSGQNTTFDFQFNF